jgi:hypothetical protein
MIKHKSHDNYKAFNSSLKMYIRELVKAFPNSQGEMNSIYKLYKMAKTINRKIPHFGFNRLLYIPYQRELRAKRAFFMDPGFRFKERILDYLHESMQSQWVTLSENDKQHHWLRLHELMDLCDKCQGGSSTENDIDPNDFKIRALDNFMDNIVGASTRTNGHL